MKVTKVKTEPEFEPIVLTIELQTLEEARELAMICDYYPLIKAVKSKIDLTEIRKAIGISVGGSWDDFIKRMRGHNVFY